MRAKTTDLAAAAVIALWAIVALPGWALAGRLLTGDESMLMLIDGLVGLVVFGATAVITVGALGLAVGLVVSSAKARLQALVVGCVTSVGALTTTLGGGVPSASGSYWLLGGWLLGLVGGPVIVALILSGGELLPPPRRRHRAPTSLPSTSTAPPTPAPPTPPTSENYWLQVAARPAPHPSELPDEPFWADLNTAGWLMVGLCAGAIVLGGYWFGGRWHRGPHPVAGFLLIGTALGVAWAMDRARKHPRR